MILFFFETGFEHHPVELHQGLDDKHLVWVNYITDTDTSE